MLERDQDLISHATQHLSGQHLIAAAVAVGTVGLGLAQGGYDPGVYAALSLALWLAVLIGVAAGLVPRAEPNRAAFAAGACLALFAALEFVSLAWATDQGAAFEQGILLLAYAGLFVLVVALSRAGEAGAWLTGLAIGLTAIAVLALASRLEPSLLGESDRALSASLPVAEGRLSYPIGYWNGLAYATATAVVILTWLGARGGRRITRAAAAAAIPIPVLVIYLATSRSGFAGVLLGVVIVIALGRSRGALAATIAAGGAAGGLLIALAAARPELLDHPGTGLAAHQGGELEPFVVAAVLGAGALRYALDPWLGRLPRVSPSPTARRRLVLAGAAGAAILLISAAFALDPAQRFEDFKAPPTSADSAGGTERDLFARGGSSGRWQFWSAAVDAFESDPLKGIGAAGYEAWWDQNGTLAAPAGNAHSLLLQTLAELGLLGAAAILGFFGIAFHQSYSRWREWRGRIGDTGEATDGRGEEAVAILAVLAVGTLGGAVDWTWQLPAVFGATVIVAALACGSALRGSEQTAPAELDERRSRRRFAGGVAVLLCAWVSICASGLAALSAASLAQSRDSAGERDLMAAAGHAEDAVDLEPWAAEPRQQLALVYEQAGDIPAARRAIAAAIDRAPDDWRLRLIAARLDVAAGDPVAARANVVAAQRLNPRAAQLDRPPGELVDGLQAAARS